MNQNLKQLQKQLKQYETRIDALSLRERGILFLVTLCTFVPQPMLVMPKVNSAPLLLALVPVGSTVGKYPARVTGDDKAEGVVLAPELGALAVPVADPLKASVCPAVPPVIR